MNPFDLRGPEFLFFYLLLSGFVILGVIWLRALIEAGPTPQVSLDDPYFFAYLRGGINEVFRAAIVVLLDRGWLIADEEIVSRRADIEPHPVQPEVEQEILSFFFAPHAAYEALKTSSLGASAAAYDKRAVALDLMPDARARGRRYIFAAIAACFLIGVSLMKIGIALARGRTNILFLVVLTTVAQIVLWQVAISGPTAKGQALLRDIRGLFGDLKGRRPFLRPGAGTKEIAWLVGVFGIGALPGDGFPDVKTLFPQSTRAVNLGGAGSSCGAATSCGSGGSCGGGCGGGGCGGGCGGCGS
ncbi:MAG TPA: TIGR04222 domain-containing membrane protein [Candidatus Dormibacteraeota bacterium]|nr:TIGR04222 domain-containing membrane protein [Candidatus Dormibacteraeota bacterium]